MREGDMKSFFFVKKKGALELFVSFKNRIGTILMRFFLIMHKGVV